MTNLLGHVPGANAVANALGEVAHVVAQTGTGLADKLYHLPGGLIQLAQLEGHALAADYHKLITNPTGTQSFSSFMHGGSPASQQIGQLETGTAQSFVDSAQHPLRDPSATLLNALALASAGTTGAVRLGAAANAARAGELGLAGKALLRTPPPAPRLLEMGRTEPAGYAVDSAGVATPNIITSSKLVPLTASQTPLIRAGQAVHDAFVQHFLNSNPGGKIAGYGTRRGGGSLDETRRAQVAMQQAPADVLAQAGATLGGGKIMGSKLVSGSRDVQQAALRLTSEQKMPDEAIQLARTEAAKGNGVQDNLNQIKLLKQVKARGLVTQDAAGNVVIDAAKHPRLAAVDAKLAAGGAERDQILKATGQATAEGLTSRIDAPGKLTAGAEHVAPTPGRAGVPSQALIRQRAYVARLEALHATATARNEAKAVPYPNVVPAVAAGTRDMTTAEMEAKLAKFNAMHDELVNTLASGYTAADASAFTAGRNARAGVNARKGLPPAQTVKGDARAYGEQQLLNLLHTHPDHPAVVRYQAALNDANAVQAELTRAADVKAGIVEPAAKGTVPQVAQKARAEKPAGPKTPGVPTDMPLQGINTPINMRLGAALSVAKDRLQQLEAAHASRIEPTGIVGGETARPGRNYVPYYSSEAKGGGAIGRTPGPVVGKVKNLLPGNKPFTGEGSLLAGKVPGDTTGLVARQMKAAYKYANDDAFRRNITQTAGSTRRQTTRDVLVNTQELKNAKVSDEVRALLDQKNLTLDELQGHQIAHEAWRQQILPGLADKFKGNGATPLGTRADPGFKWVDKNLLGELAKPAVPMGKVMRGLDTVNSAHTAATVYYKLGHIATRTVNNGFTNIVQGSGNPFEMTKGYLLWRDSTPLNRARGLAAAGEAGIHAMPSEGANVVGRVARSGSNWWVRWVDTPFRWNSIAFEARRAGFDTPAKFEDFLNKLEDPSGLSPAEAARIYGIARRANQEAIAYDRLNSFEKNYMRRVFWFYPWVKGATMYAGHVAAEHPYKSAIGGAIGAEGSQAQMRDLGPVPSYEQGLFRYGGPDATPTVGDLGNVMPFSTPANVLETLAHFNRPTQSEQLLSYATPVIGALARAAAHLDSHGAPSKHGTLHDLLQGFASTTPEYALIAALMAPADQSKKMFPSTPGYAVRKAIFGTVTPRTVNRAVLNRAAATQKKTGR